MAEAHEQSGRPPADAEPAPPLEAVELRRRELEAARASARALQAADDVRRDIGRHLHDRVQTLAIAARQQLHVGRVALDRDDPARAAEPLAEVERLLAELNAELSDLGRGLHPAGLETGLRPALDALARRAPVTLVIHELPDHPLGGSVETTIYTMVSEAINNAAKHAEATRVGVRAHAGPATLSVVVDDDGVGGAEPQDGSGLLGIRDRVTLLGGTLRVESPPGGGTTLRAVIPIAPERLAHRQFFLVGSPGYDERGDRAVEDLRSGAKRAGLSLAREWETEGGPPHVGQLMPVIDTRGRRRMTLEMTGMDLTRFCDLDFDTYKMAAVAGETLEECRAAVRAFFGAYRAEIAVLLDEPGWTLSDDEAMLVVRHRVVSDEG